jgi:hypothetical protein
MNQNEDYSPLFPTHQVIFQAIVVDNQTFLGYFLDLFSLTVAYIELKMRPLKQ